MVSELFSKREEENSQDSFKELWANGLFDNRKYYALTAPINQWSAEFPMHCHSELSGPIAEDGWGIVCWHTVVYIYSNIEMAEERSRSLGKNIKPLELKCLFCFLKFFALFYQYSDVILDETWHMKLFVCRDHENEYSKIKHIQLDSREGLFQLTGCDGKGTLLWSRDTRFSDPHRHTNWCRPIPFPGSSVSYDHSPQRGPMDLDFLSRSDSLSYFIFKNHLWARDNLNERPCDTLYTRPIKESAFSSLIGEPLRITCGEGAWIPIAKGSGKEWYIFPWAQYLESDIFSYLRDPLKISKVTENIGAKSLTNEALAILEDVFIYNNGNDSQKQKARNTSSDLLNKAIDYEPWDWYARMLYRDLKRLSLNEIPALLHADRINWAGSNRDADGAKIEFEKSLSYKKDYDFALYNYHSSLSRCGHKNEAINILEKLIRLNPSHAQGNYELALLALDQGNTETEMKHYFISAGNDPYFALPVYNIAQIYEQKNEFDLAWKYYLKALKINPFFVEAIEQLGFIFFRNGQEKACIEYFRQALKADPYRLKTYEHISGFSGKRGFEYLLELAETYLLFYLPREKNIFDQNGGTD